MSDYRLTHHRHRESSCGADAWFISFGDLLTLLLCFFLLLTPGAQTGASDSKENQSLIHSGEVVRKGGTDLASSDLDPSVVAAKMVPVWRHSLLAIDAVHNRAGTKQRWLDDVSSQVRLGRVVTVRLCEAADEGETLSQLVSRVAKVEALTTLVQFEVGVNCDSWRAQAAQRGDLLAVVTFSGI